MRVGPARSRHGPNGRGGVKIARTAPAPGWNHADPTLGLVKGRYLRMILAAHALGSPDPGAGALRSASSWFDLSSFGFGSFDWGWFYLVEPLTQIPFHIWDPQRPQPETGVTPLDFWVGTILRYTSLVWYFLPLTAILMLLRGRGLKIGIVVTGLTFLGYVFGPLYPLFWLLLALIFYQVSETFAIESQRTDVLPIGPPLAAIGAVLSVSLLVGLAQNLSAYYWEHAQAFRAWNQWLFDEAPWLFPIFMRGAPWEPDKWHADAAPPLLAAIFSTPHLIGTAYFTIRMLHYLSELKRGTLPAEQRSRLDFLCWLCYAPTLMQGPIERYPRFKSQIEQAHRKRNLRNVAYALYRFALGASKIIVAESVVTRLWRSCALPNDLYDQPEAIEHTLAIYGGVFVQIFKLYLIFASYCDVAAGISRLIGYKMIENFDKPWLATSFRDFWRRWHISLSLILRDYVYIPLGGNRGNVMLHLIITFALCGAWHAPTPHLFLWGALMGFMVWVNQRWVDWTRRIDAHLVEQPQQAHGFARLRRTWFRVPLLPSVFAWWVTMNLFCASLLVFFGKEGAARVGWELLRRGINLLSTGDIHDGLPPLNDLLAPESDSG